MMESQGLVERRLASAWSEVLRDQDEIFDHRLVLDMSFVLDRAPTLALVLGHIGPILGSAGELDVVGHDQGARSQPILFEDLANRLRAYQDGVTGDVAFDGTR